MRIVFLTPALPFSQTIRKAPDRGGAMEVPDVEQQPRPAKVAATVTRSWWSSCHWVTGRTAPLLARWGELPTNALHQKTRAKPLNRTIRATAKNAATRVGLWPAVDAYRQWRLPYMARRDQQDMRNLALLMRFWLRTDSNCIDVGANRGAVLRHIVNIAPVGRHLAFEPLPHLATELRALYPQVDVRETALGDRHGTAEFIHVVDADAYSGLESQEYPHNWRTATITVEIDRLDACLPANYAPDFIKIDVEGAEGMVIAGGMETIARTRPVIVFEHFQGGAGAQGSGPADLYPLLIGAGMEILDIDGNGPYSLTQMEEVFASRRLWTWIARPR